MEAMVYAMLDNKVVDIFLEIQEKLNITSGDISPNEQYELMEKEHELAITISKILRRQI